MNTVSTSTNAPHNPDAFLMSLEEARKIHWLRNNPRPLGELYDEGYLNRSRLEWAVAKAYDPRLKRAALTLLKTPKPGELVEKVEKKVPFQLPDSALKIGITLEQARAVLWPMPPFKGQPMGMLVETKQLTLRDLGYAAENAWDERVRRAASAMALVRLNQNVKELTPSAGFMKVISRGRSFAEHKQLQITLLEGTIMGTVLGLLVSFCIYWYTRPQTTHTTLTLSEAFKSPVGILALIILVAIIGLFVLGSFLFNRLIEGLDKKIDNYRKGQEGEQKVVDTILQTLDGNWSLFRNIQLPGRNKADLDAVLVGPSGVWVLEIKNFSGNYLNKGEDWDYYAKNKWNHYRKSPSRQAQNGAVRLANFLKADGIKQWVDGAVVWANQESPLTVENPSVAVWPLERLPDELGNVWQEEKLPVAERARIVEKLTKLSKRQEE